MAESEQLQLLIKQMAKLPGLGSRSARRAVLHLLTNKETILNPLIDSLEHTRDTIVECENCGNLDTVSPCHICTDAKRDGSVICVVEEIADLWAFERGNIFPGRYHVLGGVLSAMDGKGPQDLRIEGLINRASEETVTEVILAMNATVDGQTTAHYLTERLEVCNVKVTRLAQGIPMGGELDYLDEGTLGAALKARKSL